MQRSTLLPISCATGTGAAGAAPVARAVLSVRRELEIEEIPVNASLLIKFVVRPLFFPGGNPASWRLAGPARFAGSLGAGVYWENGRFLAIPEPDAAAREINRIVRQVSRLGPLDWPGNWDGRGCVSKQKQRARPT